MLVLLLASVIKFLSRICYLNDYVGSILHLLVINKLKV